MLIYQLLKSKITRKSYETKEEMLVMLDLYYFKKRITENQYDELTDLLEEQ